jgi:DNA-binding protein HU-beta
MNKAELVRTVSKNTGLTKKKAELAVNAFTDSIIGSLAEDKAVKLMGFGTFEVKHRAERMACNPKTREQVKVPAVKLPIFKPSKLLKNAVVR